ncbi:MAG: ABC transporter ATP-binding protein [Acidobacteria bacterium]|nr:ABC transporter ATP-binding protein [Acidobacteriota bacterium]
MSVAMAVSPDSSIRVQGLTRHYQMGPEVIRAVEDVSLEIAAGEFAALLGPSGSGKSTLLHLMAGLDQPTAGSIQVAGKELRGLSSEELARYRRHTVGMVFQAFNLIPSLRVFDNVELPLRLAEVERGERRDRVRDALERVGLGARSEHRPPQLSGGEQQRVALARALVNTPAVLFADEPTGNLDSRTGEEIMRLIEELNRTLGMTVVLVTHERPLAERYTRRMIFMADGKVVSSATAAGIA